MISDALKKALDPNADLWAKLESGPNADLWAKLRKNPKKMPGYTNPRLRQLTDVANATPASKGIDNSKRIEAERERLGMGVSGADPMELANFVNDLTQRIGAASQAVTPFGPMEAIKKVAQTVPDPLLNKAAKFVPSSGEMAAGAATLPLHIGADLSVLGHPNASPEQRLKAAGNVLLNFVGPGEVMAILKGGTGITKTIYGAIAKRFGKGVAEEVKAATRFNPKTLPGYEGGTAPDLKAGLNPKKVKGGQGVEPAPKPVEPEAVATPAAENPPSSGGKSTTGATGKTAKPPTEDADRVWMRRSLDNQAWMSEAKARAYYDSTIADYGEGKARLEQSKEFPKQWSVLLDVTESARARPDLYGGANVIRSGKAPTPTPEPKPTPPASTNPEFDLGEGQGIRHEAVDQLREEMGWQPRNPKSPKSDAEVMQEAKAHAGQEHALADEVLADGSKRTLNDSESAALGVKLKGLVDEMEAVKGKDPDAWNRLDAQAQKIADALDESGSRQGRDFRARQFVLKNSFDEWSIMRRAEKAKGAPLNPKETQAFKDLLGKHEEVAARVKTLEEEIAKLKAEGVVQRTRGARFDKASLDKELDDLFEQGKKALAKTSAGLDPELFAIAGKIALNYAKRGVNTLDEIVANVQQVWKAQFGREIDRQSVIDAMGAPQTSRGTKSDLQKQIASLRAQAKREGTANKQQITAKIADLQKQLDTGKFRIPDKREIIKSRELENLQAEQKLYQGKVQSNLNRLKQGPTNIAVQAVKDVTGLGKVIHLGSDFGVLMRQGVFGISHAIANPKSYARALKAVPEAMKSEVGLKKMEMASLEKRNPHTGGLMESVRKEGGLSRSSSLTGNHEEGYLLGVAERILKNTVGRIPGLKNLPGTLGRGQEAFLNTLRNEMFDSFYLRHPEASTKELKEWGNYINSALGRSATYGARKSPSELANIVLTSPRYEASRWEMVGNYLTSPATAAKALKSPAARAKIINMGATAGTVLGVLKTTAAVTGGELVLDPESSDFLKLRVGEKVYDLTAGIAPRLRGALRMIFFIKDPSAKTQYRKSDGQPYKRNETMPKEIVSTVTRPVTPVITGAIEDRTGYSLSGWAKDEGDPQGWERLMPLIFQGFRQDFEKGGIKEAATNFGVEFLGGSVQRYPKK